MDQCVVNFFKKSNYELHKEPGMRLQANRLPNMLRGFPNQRTLCTSILGRHPLQIFGIFLCSCGHGLDDQVWRTAQKGQVHRQIVLEVLDKYFVLPSKKPKCEFIQDPVPDSGFLDTRK